MQSRLASFIESIANIVIGFGIATAAQMWIFHVIGQPISWRTSFVVGAFMTVVSIVRSYTLRRIFNRLTHRRIKSATRY